MKILTITRFNQPAPTEHYFIRNVTSTLLKKMENTPFSMEIATFFFNENINTPVVEKDQYNAVPYWKIQIPTHNINVQIDAIRHIIREVNPVLIHSNDESGLDVKAAQLEEVPIVLTIHTAGIICPRGGGNALLNYQNKMCDVGINEVCHNCMIEDLPFKPLSKFLYSLFHNTRIAKRIADRQSPIWYFTPLFNIDNRINYRSELIEQFKQCHLIVPNRRLYNILSASLPENNLHLLPHGVKERPKLTLPSCRYPIKFYTLSRIQYSKGVLNAVKAFKCIPKDKYELHVIGYYTETPLSDKLYGKKVMRALKGINSIYHGWVPNEKIDDLIKDFHVMIHPALCHEIYGITISESLSLGRPVIATKCAGAEMQVKDHINGLLVNPNSISDLHNAIEELINNPSLIEEYSSNAFLPHNVNGYCENLIDIYSQVLSNT